MALALARIEELKQERTIELLRRASRIHKQLRDNLMAEIEVIDIPLRQEASELHEFFYSCVPSEEFDRYVDFIHHAMENPNWLCGRAGVPYRFA
jgi:hypothetical protein